MGGFHSTFGLGSSSQYKARRNRPHCHVHEDWRGGMVWAVDGDIATIRLLAEQSFVLDKIVSTSLLPAGMTTGHPCVCRVTGSGADAYLIVEVRESYFAGPDPEAGEFAPGCITTREGWAPFYSE